MIIKKKLNLLISYVITTIFLLSSCNSESPQNKIKKFRDSITSDSLNKIEKYGSSLLVAYGEAKFGITNDQFNKLFANKSINIGDRSYEIGPFITQKGSKLYGVEFSSPFQNANFIDADLLSSMNNISDVITKKYGKPILDDEKPRFSNFKPGGFRIVKGWLILNKVIRIGMREKDTGSQYQVVCQIYDMNMMNEEIKQDSILKSIKQSVDTSVTSI